LPQGIAKYLSKKTASSIQSSDPLHTLSALIVTTALSLPMPPMAFAATISDTPFVLQ
jgi:hypothetical protein